MKCLFSLVLSIAVVTVAANSQTRPDSDPLFTTVELISPWITIEGKVTFDRASNGKNCFDLMALTHTCRGKVRLDYGDRIGVNWDIFKLTGDPRSRMVDLGPYKWNDKLNVPLVEPWPELLPGQKRNITMNASGAGRNSAGYADKPVSKQVTSSISMGGRIIRADAYSPSVQIYNGHMYVIHVLNSEHDYYMLVHVEDVVRGKKVTLSYLKLEEPL